MSLSDELKQPFEFELTELQYAEIGKGPWRLYLYNDDGFHGRAKWFRLGKMKYPAEEITPSEAKTRSDANHNIGREVRITDGGDMLVFHSVNGAVVYGENFWTAIQQMEREETNEENKR